MGQHIGRLGRMREEIKGKIRILHAGDRARLIGVHEVRKLDGVADEEYRPVDVDYVPVTLLRKELHRKTARVARLLRRAAIAHHRGKSNEYRCLRAGGEHRRSAQPRNIGTDLKDAKGPGAASMHHALGNAFTVEALQLLDEMR